MPSGIGDLFWTYAVTDFEVVETVIQESERFTMQSTVLRRGVNDLGAFDGPGRKGEPKQRGNDL